MKSAAPRIVLAMLLAVGIALAVTYREHIDAAALQVWIENAGVAGSLLFMLIYALGAVLFLPGLVLTLTGGALFGPGLGTFLNLTGATLGATLAFLVARYLAADWVQRKADGVLGQLKNGVENEGWRFVAFVRLVPLFPFNVLNYALGLTRIKLTHYIATSYVCMLPGALAYTYVGYVGREVLASGEGMIQKALLALGLLALVAFLPRLIKRLRAKPVWNIDDLRASLDSAAPLLLLDVRPSTDFHGELGHITGARNVPLEELEARLPEFGDDRTRTVALVCRTDRRSAQAAQLLMRHGYANVHVVSGGMMAWNQAGLSVERVQDLETDN